MADIKRYIALIYTEEQQAAQATPAEMEQVMAAYFAFGDEATKAGIEETGEALMPTSMATSIRIRNGERITTDGPFAETKEQLGGFYVLKAKDLDEAIHWASKIPGAQVGTIEVRPLMEFPEQ